MNIENLIEDALWQINYHEQKVQEAKLKLHVYYTARDAEADNGCGQHLTDCIK